MIEQLEYDEDGNVVSVYDANRNRTRSVYDERNLLVTQNRPLEAITTFEYDDMGDQLRMTDPEGFEVSRTYDERRRMITESQGDPAETTTYGYDGNGNRTSMRRPEGGEWIYEYDDADRLVAVDNPEGDRSEFEYDANGDLATQTDGNQNATSFEYDELDRRIKMTYPDGAFETGDYDEAGNLIEMQDPKGQVSTYTYDAWNREVLRENRTSAEATEVAEAVASVWDANNNLLVTTESRPGEPSAVTTRTYDDFDRLETISDRWNNTLTYTYHANGNRTRLQHPDGDITTYSYDGLNRVTDVLVPGAGSTQYEYLLNGLPTKVTYPNGTSADTMYDGSQRVASIVNRHNTAVVSSFEYHYDENGNRVQQIESHGGQPSETTTYVYDGADRLLGVTYPDKIVTYTYDGAGNRLTETETDLLGETVLSDKLYAYNVRSQLTAMEDLLDPAGSVTYSYDANGNRISRTTGSGETTDLTFDVRDRLVEVVENGSSLGTYGYDFQGLRVSKTTPDGIDRYVYDDQSVLLRTRDGGRTTKYDYGPFRLLSVDDSEDGRAYYLFDALGSVSELTTSTGTVLGRYVWDAWGNKRSSVETGANSFGFTGHEHDEETGLVYAKARFYDPATGVFLSQDPVLGDPSNPPSLHRYLYAFQNPTVYVDPDGRMAGVREPREIDRTLIQLLIVEARIAETGRLVERLEKSISTHQSKMSLGREGLARTIHRIRELKESIREDAGFLDKLVEQLEGDLALLGEISFELENTDSPSTRARSESLYRFFREEKGLKVEHAAQMTTAFLILETVTCDENCQLLPRTGKFARFADSYLQSMLLLWGGEIFATELMAGSFTVEAGMLDDAARFYDDVTVMPRDLRVPKPSNGSLKNASGDLDAAAHAARTQPHFPMDSTTTRSAAAPKKTPRLDPSRTLSVTDTPNAGGFVRSFVTGRDRIFYRVFAGDRRIGAFLTATRPPSAAFAREALSLPRQNTAVFLQEVLVPAGTRLQRSRALPISQADDLFPLRRGGAEQFELLDRIPPENFGPWVPFE